LGFSPALFGLELASRPLAHVTAIIVLRDGFLRDGPEWCFDWVAVGDVVLGAVDEIPIVCRA
jgi:hypothetical protein